MAAAITGWNQAFCTPWITALQFHGVIFGLLLGSLWFLSGRVRLQELRRRRAAAARRARQQQAAPPRRAVDGKAQAHVSG